MYTHDLGKLVRLADLERVLRARISSCDTFNDHWLTVKQWNEESRYERWTQADAERLHRAITDRRHGVMRWLREHW
jgi:hypothetical protein